MDSDEVGVVAGKVEGIDKEDHGQEDAHEDPRNRGGGREGGVEQPRGEELEVGHRHGAVGSLRVRGKEREREEREGGGKRWREMVCVVKDI